MLFDLNQLRHQQVRDLAVSCFSEPLISDFDRFDADNAIAHCSLGLTSKRIAWLQGLDKNPESLQSYLDTIRPRRLGLYHEALWYFFLQQDEEVELITKNCQVRKGARTIGEFDVIYRNKVIDQYVHLELAFKLYLQSPLPQDMGLENWLGPNLKDRLDRKLEHMVNHQCRLSFNETAQQQLLSMGIKRVKQEISLRGYLLRNGASDLSHDPENLLNPDAPIGKWLTVSDLILLLDQYERWIPLTRINWMSPLNSDSVASHEPVAFADYLRQYFESSNEPIMVCAAENDKSGNAVERCRVMVTPDCWPGE